MIILDTCALIFDSLSPKKLTPVAKKAITHAERQNELFCCDISLWEIAMLVHKKRLDVGIDTKTFLQLMLESKQIQVLGISAEIAVLSTAYLECGHSDPADRLIAATTMHHHAKLITSDKQLRNIAGLSIIW